MNDRIVINSSPIIALGKMGLLELARKIPIDLITPTQVKQELEAGIRAGHQIDVPDWIEVFDLSSSLNRTLFERLDSGEAAVIQLASEISCNTVCLDEINGRRIAREMGLSVTGSLGILARAKAVGVIVELRPLIATAVNTGIFYDERLLERFFREVGE